MLAGWQDLLLRHKHSVFLGGTALVYQPEICVKSGHTLHATLSWQNGLEWCGATSGCGGIWAASALDCYMKHVHQQAAVAVTFTIMNTHEFSSLF